MYIWEMCDVHEDNSNYLTLYIISNQGMPSFSAFVDLLLTSTASNLKQARWSMEVFLSQCNEDLKITHDTDFLVLSLVHRDFSQCSYDIMCCRWFSQCNFMLSTLLWNLCPALLLKLCLYKVVFLYPVMLLMFKMSYIFFKMYIFSF